MATNIPIYILNNNNQERRNKMMKRFNSNFSQVHFLEPVNIDHTKYNICQSTGRNWSIMLSHLENIRHFYEQTDAEYAICCEDDVFIYKHLDQKIPTIIENMNALKLDVLLLSYLINTPPSSNGQLIRSIGDFEYYQFRDDLWGAHMYMVTRSHAKHLIDTYTLEWAQKNDDPPYSPDWILTKKGRRAFVWPPMGVEEGIVNTTDWGQVHLHASCKEFLYDESIYC